MKPNLLSFKYFLFQGLLAKCRDKQKGKLIGFNTRIRQANDRSIVITYYNTDIVRLSLDKITFNNGGFNTRSTNKRLNKYSPSGIYFFSKNNELHVSVHGYWYYFKQNMSLDRDLKPLDELQVAPMPKNLMVENIRPFLSKLDLDNSNKY